MKNLRVTKNENGYYLNEIVENGETIARYMTLKECECVSVDGSFAFFADKSNADRLKDYKAFRSSAERAANLDERGYNMEVAEHFATVVAEVITFAAKELSPESFHTHLMNEINTFFALYPTKGKERTLKIEELREAGRKALEGSELVYGSEPGATGEQENG